ncbi:hypothetical protein KAX02_08060 [candidate division WOR-3 bacterium]|nr:hypothetical protein [candidate division WOR-3 bacterium]
MGWRIELNSRGLVSVYSTITDTWIYQNLTEKEFIDIFVEDGRDSLERAAKSILERAKRRSKRKYH